ncbi:HAD family phosphatase [Geobacter sp. DSM 9736]|uniref:HAD family hydrolase n=1 Tax=Geobacter sp. DSM 9736 TaxID=1277350 RepID=UPI000B503363|nr:HAD family phosphatase [Geobacter sp. DSM 9736]SNB47363.1 haloacid dehalogenase superfamily, subfamily IA, variant 3 with third motif having DD or ED/haloacid dehalogenase superfamily, subfamily IA, variant 1 with third motif having Dx(3-4)D or Dx(3-4)E [Geobacter sp. DSM 9736]
MFRAIFWDNDGVLMETEHLYFRANAEALAGAGVDLTPELFREISLRRGESVLELAGEKEEVLRPVRDARYRELLSAEARVFPGVPDTLARLKGRLPMAIVTSCRRENFLRMHQRSGLLTYFDFVLTREDYAASKPDPEPYLTACARAGLAPEECLAVEDSERGVKSALRAGLAVAAIPGELNAGGDFTAARWHLENVADLLPLLGLN